MSGVVRPIIFTDETVLHVMTYQVLLPRVNSARILHIRISHIFMRLPALVVLLLSATRCVHVIAVAHV